MATRKTKSANKHIAREAMRAAKGGAAPPPAVKKARPTPAPKPAPSTT